MSLFPSSGSPKMPPPQQVAPMRVSPEVNKAVLDEEERRRRASMNRQMSRMSVPSLQDSVRKTGLSNRL